MKKVILKSVLAVIFTALFLSCSEGDGGSNTPTPQPVYEGAWSLNAYNFTRRVSVQTLSNYGPNKPFTIVNTDSSIMTTNNNFKACNAIFTFNTQSNGVYTVQSQNKVATFDQLNYMFIKCIVTDTAGKGAIYESNNSTVAINVETINGKFAITSTNDIVLTKTLDDGLVNAPATMIFKCDKVR